MGNFHFATALTSMEFSLKYESPTQYQIVWLNFVATEMDAFSRSCVCFMKAFDCVRVSLSVSLWVQGLFHEL